MIAKTTCHTLKYRTSSHVLVWIIFPKAQSQRVAACSIETQWICGSFLQLDIKGSFLWSKLPVGLLRTSEQRQNFSRNCIIKYNKLGHTQPDTAAHNSLCVPWSPGSCSCSGVTGKKWEVWNCYRNFCSGFRKWKTKKAEGTNDILDIAHWVFLGKAHTA